MSACESKRSRDRVYAEIATIGKGLASPHRLEPLDLLSNAFGVMINTLSRRCYRSKMAPVEPRIARAVPYLGFILVSGTKSVV